MFLNLGVTFDDHLIWTAWYAMDDYSDRRRLLCLTYLISLESWLTYSKLRVDQVFFLPRAINHGTPHQFQRLTTLIYCTLACFPLVGFVTRDLVRESMGYSIYMSPSIIYGVYLWCIFVWLSRVPVPGQVCLPLTPCLSCIVYYGVYLSLVSIFLYCM